MLARLSAFVIWALIAASAVFWLLRLAVHAPAAPPHAIAMVEAAPGATDLVRLLGAPPVAAPSATVAPEAGSRFKLLGIMAPRRESADRADRTGVALIAVDGKPPRAYPVGSHLASDLVLQSVSLRTVSIGSTQGAQTVVLEIPRLPPAATGSLPPTGSAPLPPPVPPPPVPFSAPVPGVVPAVQSPPPGAAPPGQVSIGGPQTQ